MIRTIYVIHHSHTDIGYTQGQSKVLRWHDAFIRQAIKMAQNNADFAWTCETFAPVVHFLETAAPVDRDAFLKLVAAGQIGLTASYLHFTELADAPLLESLAQQARLMGRKHGVTIDSAMQADVNGCPLVQARALAKAGVQFFLTCVHPHHGYVPFGRRQEIFRWNLGENLELTVCHIDHYHIGNELGLAPGGENNYAAGFYDTPRPFDDDILERRLPDYLARLVASGWQHDFAVVAASGLVTDNSPPSDAIRSRIERWNAKHAKDIRIEMTTPARLASVIRKAAGALPVFSGDWPDWWADGVAGDPEAVALFRHAQRRRRWLTAASAASGHPVDLTAVDRSLTFFAEHTFGHSNSVSRPWNLLAHQLRGKKLGFAADAADLVECLTDDIGDALGGGAPAYDQPTAFSLFNPFDYPVRHIFELEVEHSDIKRWNIAGPVRVVDTASKKVIPHQAIPTMRGQGFLVDVSLKPKESVILQVEPDENRPAPMDLRINVPDGAHDVRGNDADVALARIKTEFVEIEWKAPDGITRWFDPASRRDLIDKEAGIAPFALRASRLPTDKDGPRQCDARRRLGRNRNGRDAQWATSRLVRVLPDLTGEHLAGVLLDYEMTGFEMLQVRLSAFKRQPRVDVEVVMHKLGTWDAENVYIALPFSAGPASPLWLDRGFPLQPGKDQFPGSLIDYYGVQDGLGWSDSKFGVAVAPHDSHLVQTGPLDYGVRQLAGDVPADWRPQCVYAWAMTNYWETNFSPELGGFYSFRFSVSWGPELADPKAAMHACRAMTTALPPIRLAAK